MYRSLLFQLWSTFFLVTLATLSVVFVLSTLPFHSQIRTLFQHLYFEVADELVRDLKPHLQLLDVGQLRREFARYEARDPRISIFLVDARGQVLVSSPGYSVRSHGDPSSFNLQSIERFLTHTQGLNDPIYLFEGTSNESLGVFSASPAQFNGQSGYLLVILKTEFPDSPVFKRALSRRLLLFVFCLVSSSVVGWLVFFFITRRIARMKTALQRFTDGDFSHRVSASGSDEISRYAASFNSMAESAASSVISLTNVEHVRREMFANISHDIRRPMASIMSFLEAVGESPVTLGEKRERDFLHRARGRAEELAKLVADIGELSELDRPTYSVSKRRISLNDEVQDLIASFQQLAEQRKLSLVLEMSNNTLHALADPALLKRALSNLIENALLYTEQGKVVVSLSTGSGTARLSVTDTGSGISSEDLVFIFNPFARGSQARTQNNKGSGLGLSIAKQIVELHSGVLSVASTVGSGTEFLIEMPIL